MPRLSVRDDLRRGEACSCARTAAPCRGLLSGEIHPWTFVRVEGVEPTNNDAERAPRHGVSLCKTGGIDSEAVSRLVERMLTVAASCRRQSVDVLDDLTRCHQATLDRRAAASLLPPASAIEPA